MSGARAVVAGPGWEELVVGLGKETTMVVGGPATGKSCLVRYLADRLVASGRRIGLVSADMGQASVGPPACLGLATSPPWETPDALWFIGSTSPHRHLLQTVVGTGRLVRRARVEGSEVVVIDTTGLVEGTLGRLLKYHKAVAAEVDHLVALQFAGELEPLLGLLDAPGRILSRLTPAAGVQDRGWAERKAHREARFRAHFEGGSVLSFNPDRLVGLEWAGGSVATGELAGPGTVVGLLDSRGFCLGLGIVEVARSDRLTVYTACPAPEAVARIQVGELRLTRDGEELS